MKCSVPAAVAIPARNEAAYLEPCLRALAAQSVRPAAVVVMLNNCTDDSAARMAALAPSLPFPVHAPSIELPPGQACAGWARRLAMQHAARLVGPDGVLLGTDADSVADPDWVEACLDAIATGAEAVAGIVDIDPEDALRLPPALHEDDARECAYASQLDEIAALADPDPADPWPRHDQQSGASFAATVRIWRQAGGIPPVRLGEDRAFFDALRRVDARIRHSTAARVIVSGRLHGRARGGMADTMRRRLTEPDRFLDGRLEPAEDAAFRALWRQRLRRAWGDERGAIAEQGAAAELELPVEALGRLLLKPYFGAAWTAIEAHSRRLRRRRVPVSDLPIQAAEAGLLIARLRPLAEPEDRADTRAYALTA